MKEKSVFRERLQKSWQNIKDRTGFFAFTDAHGKVQRGKTLWDWMQLLAIPVVLALASFWFSYSKGQSDMAIAVQRLQEDKLNAYLSKMEGYILDLDLLVAEDQENQFIIQVAQVQTVTALRSMDKERRDLVFQFLRDSGLNDFVLVNVSLVDIDLSENNLLGVNLSDTDLSGANLFGVNLSGANLFGVDLSGANLSRAILNEAYLREANLSGANLRNATYLTIKQLRGMSQLAGATIPGGQCYEGEFDLEGDKELAAVDGVNPNDPEALARWYREQ